MDHEIKALIDHLQDLRALVGDLSDEEFGRPSRCPDWTVAVLVGHCEGLLVSLVSESAQPVDGAPEIDRVGVYGYGGKPREAQAPGHVRVRDRAIGYTEGRRPAQLRTSFQFVVDGAVRAMAEIPGDRVVLRPTAAGRLTYCELVASRHIEFGVHMMDIASSTGRPEKIRPESAAIITGILDRMLGQKAPEALGWDSTRYILSGTGRRQLEPAELEILGPLASRFPLLR
jgi:uncharacterized protein (TIGR03083 family)